MALEQRWATPLRLGRQGGWGGGVKKNGKKYLARMALEMALLHIIHTTCALPPLQTGRAQPLTFTAAKSRLGHAETGAGVLGMLHAWWQLTHCAAPGITHLRAVNPYVEGSLQRSQGAVFLPRQPAAGFVGSLCTGISSFAFQVGGVEERAGWLPEQEAGLLIGLPRSCQCRAPMHTCCSAGQADQARTSRRQLWLRLCRGRAADSGPVLQPIRCSAAACCLPVGKRPSCCCKQT